MSDIYEIFWFVAPLNSGFLQELCWPLLLKEDGRSLVPLPWDKLGLVSLCFVFRHGCSSDEDG